MREYFSLCHSLNLPNSDSASFECTPVFLLRKNGLNAGISSAESSWSLPQLRWTSSHLKQQCSVCECGDGTRKSNSQPPAAFLKVPPPGVTWGKWKDLARFFQIVLHGSLAERLRPKLYCFPSFLQRAQVPRNLRPVNPAAKRIQTHVGNSGHQAVHGSLRATEKS